MTITLPPGEPPAGPWATASFGELLRLLHQAPVPAGRPRIVAVDGRSAGGKSTLADRLHAAVPASAVVHIDDISWHESYFGWAPLLVQRVLEPLRRGEAVRYRPSAWEARGRDGAIEVPAGLDLVIVEGVGSSQRAVSGLLDASVWVQSDFQEAERRGIARDAALGVNGDAAETVAFWHQWMAEELPFLEQDRPWERATVIVSGTPSGAVPDDEVLLAPGPLQTP
ncbi:uridine kinase [Kineococcus xinjiangensis]|uniref:Uridine kinase n=1 Tax=Kineococcus xinjiangensis TaxID=512762 RepID=A0A2S6IFC2_9ACTN|nr:hypothetical protein [Kineococcus xinjiangensis]PPK92886.1 uridine kinase [Kineococcus xinjiangensis]